MSDQDGEADSLALSEGISDAAPDSTGAADVPGEPAVPDGEHATRAAPNASSKTIRFSMWSPPGNHGAAGIDRHRAAISGPGDRTGRGASGVPVALHRVVAGGSQSSAVRTRPTHDPL
jgi:hypothetical protein